MLTFSITLLVLSHFHSGWCCSIMQSNTTASINILIHTETPVFFETCDYLRQYDILGGYCMQWLLKILHKPCSHTGITSNTHNAWMSQRGDGPIVHSFLLFQVNLYLFIRKLELKCCKAGGIFVVLLDLLQTK